MVITYFFINRGCICDIETAILLAMGMDNNELNNIKVRCRPCQVWLGCKLINSFPFEMYNKNLLIRIRD